MNPWRVFELRQCVGFVREATAAVERGDLSKAIRLLTLATRGTYFVRGLTSASGKLGGTAGLSRVIANLGDAIEGAARPAPAADPFDLLEDIAEGYRVLRLRDGIDLDEKAVYERARNVMTGLLGNYDVRQRRDQTTPGNPSTLSTTTRSVESDGIPQPRRHA